MVAGFEQRPWTPTVRRGQIAAETSTPGPAAVALPNLIGNLNSPLRPQNDKSLYDRSIRNLS